MHEKTQKIEEEEEDDGPSYNIYANRKVKKQNKITYKPQKIENEGFSNASEIKTSTFNNRNKYNKRPSTNQLYADNEDFNDYKFNETLKDPKSTNNISNRNKPNTIICNSYNYNNETAKDNDVNNNKYSVRQKFIPPKM